ncbi:hypothetical protein NNW97_23825, partial [Streptomyces parvus]|nr:hypothetical protein [Streptomyces parvus]
MAPVDVPGESDVREAEAEPAVHEEDGRRVAARADGEHGGEGVEGVLLVRSGLLGAGGECGDGAVQDHVGDAEPQSGGLDPADEPDGEEGVAAEFEEAVVDADPFHSEDLREQRAQHLLHRIPGLPRG